MGVADDDSIDTVQARQRAARRDFLKRATVAGTGAGVLSASAGASDTPDALAVDVTDNSDARGYRRTEHVEAYYRHARF